MTFGRLYFYRGNRYDGKAIIQENICVIGLKPRENVVIHTKHFVLAALLSTSVLVRAEEECVPCCATQQAQKCADRKECPKACQEGECAQEDATRGGCCDTRSEAMEEEAVVAQKEANIHLEATVQLGEQQQTVDGKVIPGQENIINVGKDLAFVTQVQPVAEDANAVDITVALFERTEGDQAKEHGRCTVRAAWGQRAEIACEGSDLKLHLVAHRA